MRITLTKADYVDARLACIVRTDPDPIVYWYNVRTLDTYVIPLSELDSHKFAFAYKTTKVFLDRTQRRDGAADYKRFLQHNFFGATDGMKKLVSIEQKQSWDWVVSSRAFDDLAEMRKKAKRYTTTRRVNFLSQKQGKACAACGGVSDLTVDHIKPLAKYPELFMTWDNLQILCRSCNSKKGTT